MGKITPIAKNDLRESVELFCGTVSAASEGMYHVLTDYGTVMCAHKAEGCLIAPDAGDRVLVASETNGDVFILNILSKENRDARIIMPGKVIIEGEEVSVCAGKSVSMDAPKVRLAGAYGEVHFAGFSLLVNWCEIRVKRAVVVAQKLDNIVDTLTEKMRNCFRNVENMEQTKAGRIRTIVQERFFLRSKNASVVAEEDVSMDGKQIHVG